LTPLVDARAKPHGVVDMEGDWEGQIYLAWLMSLATGIEARITAGVLRLAKD